MKVEELPKWVIPVAVGAVSFVAGAAAGYFATRRQYNQIQEDVEKVSAEVDENQLQLDLSVEEIKKATGRIEYVTRRASEEGDRLVSTVREMAIIKDLPVESMHAHPSSHRPDPRQIVTGLTESEEPGKEDDMPQIVHIFQEEDDTWDYEFETANRNRTTPYVIHRDEFHNDEMGYLELGGQRCFTYYAADDIVTDEMDVPIYRWQDRLGPLKFGHGSGDPNIVYIRNEAESEEYEVLHSDESYQDTEEKTRMADFFEQEDLKHAKGVEKFRFE